VRGACIQCAQLSDSMLCTVQYGGQLSHCVVISRCTRWAREKCILLSFLKIAVYTHRFVHCQKEKVLAEMKSQGVVSNGYILVHALVILSLQAHYLLNVSRNRNIL